MRTPVRTSARQCYTGLTPLHPGLPYFALY